ncbi:N-terminal acetyltransferase A, auxiliary subunit [Acaromyces ingoldii]|uniref:N-terminal acetyltransferase A, auxiliary subunit n=1 Tax=Acaromyces ingoldii TaxID=215250 RepID=A0A316YK59_9BASI|nr:N-terminal acetyltransferase A, auxiliary subunit [Acaromyces ingoldii]PWN89562.1 N-terminal acetyltransferase A, auxiliary subunit [Acaromyces ingoldii]
MVYFFITHSSSPRFTQAMAPPLKKSSTTQLPTKERGLFARLIQEYETKKHKTGLKTADQILKKFPEHGETLCMKGLLLASVDRRAEGIELARKGVRFDLTSFISWHALGILNRMDKNYDEAIKCYGQALRIEGGTNINLIRESAYLHLQQRNFASLIDNRLTLVRSQPHLRINWAGLAVAHHLAGSLEEAVRVLEGFESVCRDVPRRSFEQSEIYLYHASILYEAGKYEEAKKLLADRKDDEVVDRKALDVLTARCQFALGKREEAERIYNDLLSRNGEDRSYLAGWLEARGVATQAESDEAREKATKAFEELRERFPKSRAVKRLALVYLGATSNDFKSQARDYLQTAFEKGVPSVFTDIRSLYGDVAKRDIIEEIVEEMRQTWFKDQGEPPSSYLWAIYYLAQHYSHLGQDIRALEYADSAIAHTPSMPELHMTRARILKRAGSLQWASQAMEDARSLDGQDRFLNCKSAKYYLRIDDVDTAVARVGLFTKPDAPSPVHDLVDMQAFWYLLEEANAWERKANYAMALKRHGQIDKTFTEIWDDQLDFHSYCIRKFTLRAYVDMVRFEDQLRSHPAYFVSALSAIRILTKLHDQPDLYKPDESSASKTNGELTDEQRKEAKKARKAELKAAEEAAAAEAAKKKAEMLKQQQDKKKGAAKKAADDDEEMPPPPKDEDPQGTEALKKVDPLVDAQKHLTQLQKMAGRRVETWLATFEVAYRSKNWLLATRAVAHAHAIDASNAELQVQLVKLRKALDSNLNESTTSAIRDSIEATWKHIVGSEQVSLEQFISQARQTHGESVPHALAHARSILVLRREAKEEAVDIVLQTPKMVKDATATSQTKGLLSQFLEVRQFVLGVGSEANVEEFDRSCEGLFAMADVFKSDKRRGEEEKRRVQEKRSWEPSKTDEDVQGPTSNGSSS